VKDSLQNFRCLLILGLGVLFGALLPVAQATHMQNPAEGERVKSIFPVGHIGQGGSVTMEPSVDPVALVLPTDLKERAALRRRVNPGGLVLQTNPKGSGAMWRRVVPLPASYPSVDFLLRSKETWCQGPPTEEPNWGVDDILGFLRDSGQLPPTCSTTPGRSIARRERRASIQAQSLLDRFDPELDIAFFDYDETLAQGGRGKNDSFKVGGLLDLFLTMARDEKKSKRTFILSNGNTFLFDATSTAPDPHPDQAIFRQLRELPILNSEEAKSANAFRVTYMHRGFRIYEVRYPEPDPFHNTRLFRYYPQFHAFHIEAGVPRLARMDSRHLKGLVLPTVLQFLGISAEKPIRNLYVFDNESSYLIGLAKGFAQLKREEIFTGDFFAVHIPFDMNTTQRIDEQMSITCYLGL
jgi:hypothetical protein